MPLSLKTAGSWSAALSADTAITIPGSPAAGDRMFLFAAWKAFGTTAQITSPQAWTEVTEFTDGSVAAGSNVGSVKVGAWYRDWVSGDGNPTLDFSVAPVPGVAVIMLWQKTAGESWDTPTFVTAAITAADPWSATSSSTITIEDGAVVMELIALRDDSSTLTRNSDTALDDDGSPTVTWNGNVVESPATHFSTTSSNDISADLVHRFVTTGASGVNLTTTGDPVAAETGAALWIHQNVNPPTPVSAPITVTFTVAHSASRLLQQAANIGITFAVAQLKKVNKVVAIATTFTLAVLRSITYARAIGVTFTLSALRRVNYIRAIAVTFTVAAVRRMNLLASIPVTFTLSVLRRVNAVIGISVAFTVQALDEFVPLAALPLAFNIPFTYTVTVTRRGNLIATIPVTFAVSAVRRVNLLAVIVVSFAVGLLRGIRKVIDIIVSTLVEMVTFVIRPPPEINEDIPVTFTVVAALQVTYVGTQPTSWNEITRELPPAGSIDKVGG